MMKATKFVRKPFYVDAVQVTQENLEEVAKWCFGDVREGSPKPGVTKQKYIKVRVLRPHNERQTMAFPGDFVLYSGAGYKVYTGRAFVESFEPAEDDYNYGEQMVKDELCILPGCTAGPHAKHSKNVVVYNA